MGYDGGRKPVYTTELYQGHVFGVLLVDYWQPPYELWRENPAWRYGRVVLGSQDVAPLAVSFTEDSAVVASGGAEDSTITVPTGSPG